MTAGPLGHHGVWKTVVAAALIAERRVNTLILTHRQQLLSQWMARLSQFLRIDEELPEMPRKRGRKPMRGVIGQIGAGKDSSNGIIDVGIMQSVMSDHEVKECVRDYGMVIVDECHHISAVSFEQIIKNVRSKYVYGLTATPVRRDGRHPIIFMHCGPIRYRADAKEEARKRPFDHYVIPRFTGLRIPSDREEADMSIQELYSGMLMDGLRNEQIIDDVIRAHAAGRNSLILTKRTAHVELLAAKLREKIPQVMTLTGGKGMIENRTIMARIADAPASSPLTLLLRADISERGLTSPAGYFISGNAHILERNAPAIRRQTAPIVR